MDRRMRRDAAFDRALCALPGLLSLAGALTGRRLLYVLALTALFGSLLLPERARGRESLWLSLLALPVLLPMDAALIFWLLEDEPLRGPALLLTLLQGLTLLLIFLSAQELLLLALSRLIWRKQRKIRLPADDEADEDL
ncbi:MAG: hypothetical protein IK095_00285 [Oscillospiraceae bacterium]|nr:hypothetical protein [Oscillospiraceae bacterium]